MDEGEPPFNPVKRSPIFDLRETTVDFELVVLRIGSSIIANGVSTITATGFAQTRDVLNAWDRPQLSDFPTSGFELDLILNAPTLRPPFLHPAKMLSTGLLVPDTSYKEVSIRLPKLRFRFTHGNATGSTLTFELVSAGVSGLDDPGDIGVAELVSMEPAYAFVGGVQDRTVGFGFRKAVLDLAEGYTPPAITEKFGFGNAWGGLYLPEVRFFIAPEGAWDFAFEAGVQDLLIGIGDDAGVSGDFELALINQGSGSVKLSARFFDANGRVYGIAKTGETTAIARIPEQTRMVVDIQGGRTPYHPRVQVGSNPEVVDQRVFNINLSGAASQNIVINVTDSTAGTPVAATLTITAERRTTQPTLPTPGTQPAPPLTATLSTNPSDPIRITIASQNDQEVLLTTEPINSTLLWSVDGGAESTARSSLSVAIAKQRGISTRVVQLRWLLDPEQMGYPTEPFQVWRRPSVPMKPEKEIQPRIFNSPLNYQVITWDEPQVYIRTTLNVTNSNAQVYAFTGAPFTSALVGFEVLTPGLQTANFSGSAIQCLVVSLNTDLRSLIGISSDAANDESWQLIETVGLPVGNDWAGVFNLDEPQGIVGSLMALPDAALDRYRRAAPFYGWELEMGPGLPAPPWELAKPQAILDTMQANLLRPLKEMIQTRPPAEHYTFELLNNLPSPTQATRQPPALSPSRR